MKRKKKTERGGVGDIRLVGWMVKGEGKRERGESHGLDPLS